VLRAGLPLACLHRQKRPITTHGGSGLDATKEENRHLHAGLDSQSLSAVLLALLLFDWEAAEGSGVSAPSSGAWVVSDG
jgi:hypothetical protein